MNHLTQAWGSLVKTSSDDAYVKVTAERGPTLDANGTYSKDQRKPWAIRIESTHPDIKSTSISLRPNGVTGDINEAGVKRYRAAMSKADKLGVPIQWMTPFDVSPDRYYESREALESRLSELA